jgi:hypothetical protein
MLTIIQESGKMSTTITTSLDDITGKISEVNNSVTELQNVDMKIDKKITTINNKQISPNITMPEISPLTNPLDDIEVPQTNINFDIKSGDVIYNVMNAIDTAINNVLNGIIDNIKNCITKLMSPSDIIKKIKEWLKDLNKKIWTAIKNKYNEWSNNIVEYKNSKNKTYEELWTRALTWLKKKIKELSDILVKIKKSVLSLCSYLDKLPSLLQNDVSTFSSSLGDVSSDINELTIQSTRAFA